MSNADQEIYPRATPPARSRVSDAIIVSSMIIVSLAFATGLGINGGFGIGPSIIGGLGLFVLSMLIHTIVRRVQSLTLERVHPAEPDESGEVSLELDRTDAPRRSVVAGEGDLGHGWGEPEAVNDLVRQLTTELQNVPDGASSTASPRAAPSPLPHGETSRPMATNARPLGQELPATATDRPQRNVPPRTPVPPIARQPREDLAEVVRRAYEAEGIEIHLQPVMSLGNRRAQLYESFPRLRDGRGGLIRPETYARACTDAALLAGIERLAFRRTVQILGRLVERGKQRPIFCPLSAEALRDGTFLRAFHETLKAGPALASNLIFELSEADLARLGPAERDAIHALANAGFRFSLQDVMQLDMAAIGDLPIAFVKLLPIALHGQPGHAAGLVARVRSIGAEPVVDGVEGDHDISVAQALGIVLGQGGFLSEPRPLKADVVGEFRTGT
jgi:EAL domain-containing protein (putative c-di-GMP-specific phosphodiesterase class I)